MSFSVTDLPDDMLGGVFELAADCIADIRLVCKRFELLASPLIRTIYLNYGGYFLTKESVNEDFSFLSRVGNDQTMLKGKNLSALALACIGPHLSRFQRVEIYVCDQNYHEEFFRALFALLSTRLEVLMIHFTSDWSLTGSQFEIDFLVPWLDRFFRSRCVTLREANLLNGFPSRYYGLPFFIDLYPALRTCMQLTNLTVAKAIGKKGTELQLTKDLICALPNLTSLCLFWGSEKGSAELLYAFLKSARAPREIEFGFSNPISELSILVGPACSFSSVRCLSGPMVPKLSRDDADIVWRLFPGLERLDTTFEYSGEKIPPDLKSVAIQSRDKDVEGIVSLMPPRLEEMMLSTAQEGIDLLRPHPMTPVWQRLRRLDLAMSDVSLPRGVLASLSQLPELVFLELEVGYLDTLDFGPFLPIPTLQTLHVHWDYDCTWNKDGVQFDFARLSRACPSLTSLQIPVNPLLVIAPFEPLLKLRQISTFELPTDRVALRVMFSGMPALRVVKNSELKLSNQFLDVFSSTCPSSVRTIVFGSIDLVNSVRNVDLSRVVRFLARLPRVARLVLNCRVVFPAGWEAAFSAVVARLSSLSFMCPPRFADRLRSVDAPWCELELHSDHSDGKLWSVSDTDDSDKEGSDTSSDVQASSESDSAPPTKRLHLDY